LETIPRRLESEIHSAQETIPSKLDSETAKTLLLRLRISEIYQSKTASGTIGALGLSVLEAVEMDLRVANASLP